MSSNKSALWERWRSLPDWAWLSLATLVALAGYLALSANRYGVGFPLDDAWIHQTYARNLALEGEWSFVPGRPSAGSTSPLWSLVLSAGYLIHLAPLTWSFLLGGVILVSLATYLVRQARASGELWHFPVVWIGLFVVFEYHLVWAAVSGMETLLSGLINTVVILSIAMRRTGFFKLGVLIGLGLWVRPDSLTLLGPAVVWLFWQGRERFWQNILRLIGGVALLLVPYLLFNLWLDGSWWPNTYYAKQTEYAALLTEPLLTRLARLYSLPLIGAGALLAPGFVLYGVKSFRERHIAALLGVIWWAGFFGLYAMRLPVIYQHGRYLMPAMPLFFYWGLLGTNILLSRIKDGRAGNLLRFGIRLSTGMLLAGFYLLGGQAYARDVGFVETQMVAAARWVAQNTSPDATLAAHDIGALGYFGGRELLDLAGLVSPEVIPILRDEAALSQYISAQRADYLLTLTHWYTRLHECGEIVYIGDASLAQELGGEQMAVYHWIPGCQIE
jgi:hypothetical protein